MTSVTSFFPRLIQHSLLMISNFFLIKFLLFSEFLPNSVSSPLLRNAFDAGLSPRTVIICNVM